LVVATVSGVAEDVLQFDPAVVPKLRSAYADALAKVDEQIRLAEADGVVNPLWADDPISQYAGSRLTATTETALDALRSYRDALDAMVAKLAQAGINYHESEQDKDVSMSQHGQG